MTQNELVRCYWAGRSSYLKGTGKKHGLSNSAGHSARVDEAVVRGNYNTSASGTWLGMVYWVDLTFLAELTGGETELLLARRTWLRMKRVDSSIFSLALEKYYTTLAGE